MAYRNKIYVSFDADTDMHYYRLMSAWKSNPNIYFKFYDAHKINSNPNLKSETLIKRQLQVRFLNTKIFVILVGQNTRYLYKYVRWEIEQALKLNLPIIVVNKNGKRILDRQLCPPIIRDELAVHVCFKRAIIMYALNNWPAEHRQRSQNKETGNFYYLDYVYKSVGI
ncbi:MAG: molecular chaperone Tir [Symploca sp. SIO2G7]|nr:molecular chaperone Tir [Symploca sp. SIO2G7]